MAHLMLAAFDPLGVLMTIIGLGGLIFFHELGHFLACRLTGTRVEAFSIGFGREIFGWTRKGTRYRVGMVPLGGYVKMAAENPGEKGTGAPDEFPNKPFSARLFIMSAGVLFNLILAFALFVWAFGIGVPLQSARIGSVLPGGAAWKAGLKPGDLVTHVDGREVLDYMDLASSALAGPGPIVFTVERDGTRLEIPVHPGQAGADLPLGILPAVNEEAADVTKDSPIAEAGGKAGDVVVAIDGKPVPTAHAIEEMLTEAAKAAAPGAETMEATVRVRRQGGAEEDLRVTVPLAPMIGITPFKGAESTLVIPQPDSAASRAGIEEGDQIVSVAGTPVSSFGDISKAMRANGIRPVALEIRHGDKTVTVEVTPAARPGDLGYAREFAQTVHRERNVFRAMALGWRRTTRFIEMVLLTVKGLVTRHVSTDAIGGPIALVTATYNMADQGWGLYLQILGLISVNLAILNLLPIPVLDGGQIVLLCAEKLRGKPLPERVVGWLQMAGLVFILGLLVLAFKNDIARILK
ncbi:MAG TPA: RIP metalloprotease RseP [Planctomycetota bacterium]|nr:RIP metalloprotease RseP [Planctomycetota bacterium]